MNALLPHQCSSFLVKQTHFLAFERSSPLESEGNESRSRRTASKWPLTWLFFIVSTGPTLHPSVRRRAPPSARAELTRTNDRFFTHSTHSLAGARTDVRRLFTFGMYCKHWGGWRNVSCGSTELRNYISAICNDNSMLASWGKPRNVRGTTRITRIKSPIFVLEDIF